MDRIKEKSSTVERYTAKDNVENLYADIIPENSEKVKGFQCNIDAVPFEYRKNILKSFWRRKKQKGVE